MAFLAIARPRLLKHYLREANGRGQRQLVANAGTCTFEFCSCIRAFGLAATLCVRIATLSPPGSDYRIGLILLEQCYSALAQAASSLGATPVPSFPVVPTLSAACREGWYVAAFSRTSVALLPAGIVFCGSQP